MLSVANQTGESAMVSGMERDAKTAPAFSVERFADRAIGPRPAEQRAMLAALGLSDLDALVESVVPRDIRLPRPLQLPPPRSEQEALTALRALAAHNQVFRSFIGQGYHDCVLPPVIQRLVLENPGWYTPYTPYQAEIAQGRLEALLNFQTLIIELTGLEVANASLLDEGTAAAEALHVCEAIHPGRPRFLVSAACHPQTIEVVQTRAQARGLEVVVDDHRRFVFDASVCGALVQYPDTFGVIHDFRPLAEQAHAVDALLVVAGDLLALTCLPPPAEFGADIAVGSAQRFGIPMAYGGPHAAFFAVRDRFKRNLPGRIVGVSRDARGRPAFRLALQTREQHIRREKATSNICTAQALLASMAAFYAMYHGPDGLRRIALRVHELTRLLAAGLERLGYHGRWADHLAASADSFQWPACFDTLTVELGRKSAAEIVAVARAHRMNFRVVDERTLGVALNETTTEADVAEIWQVFNQDRPVAFTVAEVRSALAATGGPFPPLPERRSPFLSEPAFQRYHSETEMMRYLKRLESRDLSLTGSMVPLGSCTMKLNPAAAMLPITWPEFARVHPFAPLDQASGYTALIRQLEAWLAEITGFAAVSVQPNAGSQGEFAGLLAIRAYHRSRGEGHRTVCLIPTSAHGTNPASAVLAGLQVVPVACDAHGNVDLADLRAKAATHQRELACLMVTYPSTHGVFEPAIREICEIIHVHGGQVYMDGANLNAQVGLTSPAQCGADVCHLNLHKTFAIPHGGGGPGVGPVGVAAHLVDFLPGHQWLSAQTGRAPGPVGAVSAAPWGSAGILPITWMYIAMMGAEGLTRASQVAILNANYVAKRLASYFPTLYRGPGAWVAHECILDLRRIRRAGAPDGREDGELLPVKLVTVEDVAKRLMDYGFHAPTVSWPVAGTMMVEPTESESKAELDRFCEAMIRIHAEMFAVETGLADRHDNPLKNAPHTADQVAADEWPHAYSREQAAFPVPTLREAKFWPAVARIDNVYGDRHLVCSCAGMEAFLAEPASPAAAQPRPVT